MIVVGRLVAVGAVLGTWLACLHHLVRHNCHLCFIAFQAELVVSKSHTGQILSLSELAFEAFEEAVAE